MSETTGHISGENPGRTQPRDTLICLLCSFSPLRKILWDYTNILLFKPSSINFSIHHWITLATMITVVFCFSISFIHSFYINSLELFYREGLYLLSHFFTYSIIYLYHYGLMGNYFSLVYYPMLSLFILLSNCLGFSHWEFFQAGSCIPFFFEHFLTFWN